MTDWLVLKLVEYYDKSSKQKDMTVYVWCNEVGDFHVVGRRVITQQVKSRPFMFSCATKKRMAAFLADILGLYAPKPDQTNGGVWDIELYNVPICPDLTFDGLEKSVLAENEIVAYVNIEYEDMTDRALMRWLGHLRSVYNVVEEAEEEDEDLIEC